MTDRIHLKNMAFFAHHGVHEEEAKLGQRFYLDATCELDLGKAGRSDHYADAVCYEKIYRTVSEVVTERRFKLIEALAEEIAAQILARFAPVRAVTIEVRKPNAPIVGLMDHVAIEIRRERHD